MPVKVEIVPALPEHADELAPYMRDEDVAEIRAGGYASALHALQYSLAASVEAYALMLDGKVAALFGVAHGNLMGGSGHVWLLTGRLVDKHRFAFVRNIRRALEKALPRWPHLRNMVDSRYVKAVRLVKALGFEVGEPVPVGAESILFLPFYSRSP